MMPYNYDVIHLNIKKEVGISSSIEWIAIAI
jgi:hypothetical protein